jgi:hypothetical protein
LKDKYLESNYFLRKVPTKKGYLPERRLYAHGQGYDLVEKPLIRYDKPLKIKVGMKINIHPVATNETVWVIVCDNYLVTETSVSARLHNTPKEIIVV